MIFTVDQPENFIISFKAGFKLIVLEKTLTGVYRVLVLGEDLESISREEKNEYQINSFHPDAVVFRFRFVKQCRSPQMQRENRFPW